MRQIEDRASMKVLYAIEDDLLKDPERGDIIPGSHGARKARIGDPDSRKGSVVVTGTSTRTFAVIIT